MAKVRLVKEGAFLAPFDTESEEWLHSQVKGAFFNAEIKSPRNLQFHKKFFALLNVAYPYWHPVQIDSRYGAAKPSKEQFRKDITILSGHYEVTARIYGEPIITAKSISFAKMDDSSFAVFYSDVVDTVIKHVLRGWTIEQVDNEVGTFL